jgi:hypothetical protein
MKVINKDGQLVLTSTKTFKPTDKVARLKLKPKRKRNKHTIQYNLRPVLFQLLWATIFASIAFSSGLLVFVAFCSFIGIWFNARLHIQDPLFSYANHSFTPNIMIDGLNVICIKDIEPGDEIVFNYHTTEDDISKAFFDEDTQMWIG